MQFASGALTVDSWPEKMVQQGGEKVSKQDRDSD